MASATSPGVSRPVDHVGRELAVERLTVRQQALQVALRPDQRAIGRGSHARAEILERHVEEHGDAGVPQRDPVRRLQDDAAAARHDGGIVHARVRERRRL